MDLDPLPPHHYAEGGRQLPACPISKDLFISYLQRTLGTTPSAPYLCTPLLTLVVEH